MTSRLLFATALLAPALLPAQTATFTAFGTGCSGSDKPCLSANWGRPFIKITGVSENFAILFNTGSQARVVCGVELLCARSRTGQATVPVSIWHRAANGQPGTMALAAMMPVTTTPQAHRAMFLTPLILKPNTDYFVVIDNRVNLHLPVATNGSAEAHYFGGPPIWNGPSRSLAWNYRILCCGSGLIPKLSNTGTPSIGQSFSIDLSNAPANAKVLYAVGVAQTSMDLTAAGAPGCTLLTNPLAVLPLTADAQGNTSVKVAVPNNQALIGFTFNNQFGVLDNANPLGLIFSNGGAGKVGR